MTIMMKMTMMVTMVHMTNLKNDKDIMMMMSYFRCNPGRMIHLSFLLEAELGICHVYPGIFR